MKKSSHTMERNIGIYVLGLLVFLAISCSQDVLAVNNVTLKVNAGNNTTTANKIYYRTGTATTTTPVTLPWAEKAVYNGTATADADVKITVTNEMLATTNADLIVKVDFLTASTGGAMSVLSGWLKYKDGAGKLGEPGIVVAHDTNIITYDGDTVTINRGDLKTLVLKKDLVGKSVINIMNFSTKFLAATHVIFTAVLVDNVGTTLVPVIFPQVVGVDIQSIFFNYIDTSVTATVTTVGSEATAWYEVEPIWLTFIKAD